MSASSSSNTTHAQLAAQLLSNTNEGVGFEVIPLDETSTDLSSIDESPLSTDKAHELLEIPCSCGDVGENWLCLSCRTVVCSRNRNGCAVKHAELGSSTNKCQVHLSFSDLSIWDHAADSYLNIFTFPEFHASFKEGLAKSASGFLFL